MIEAPFWMVLNERTSYTNYRHDSFDAAYNEALRLATEHPGQKFHVLRCCGHHLVQPPTTWTPRMPIDENSPDLPF